METMHQHLHGRCSLCVGKPEVIRRTDQLMNPEIAFTRCFLHRQAIISKSMIPEVQTVLDETIKMVNFINSRPLESRLFLAVFCHGSCSHAIPTAHGSEVAFEGGYYFQRSMN
jgi:hypothetical protein